jgi:hypothetical protein
MRSYKLLKMLRPQQCIKQISQENQGNQAADTIFPSHGVLLQSLGYEHITPGKAKEDQNPAEDKQVHHAFSFVSNSIPVCLTAILRKCKG